jgi:cobalt-zinc-cadmium resistance protein CzcA
VSIDPFYDRTELVDNDAAHGGPQPARGRSLVIAVLFMFLLDMRAALVVASSSRCRCWPRSSTCKARGMSRTSCRWARSTSASSSTAAWSSSRASCTRLSRRVAARWSAHRSPHLRATREVVRPTVFALLIIIAAYLPIFMLQRVEGRIFAPMANTVVAALGGALLLSSRSSRCWPRFVYRRPVKHRESPCCAGRAPVRAVARVVACADPVVVIAGAAALAARSGRCPGSAPSSSRAQRGRALPHLHAALEHLAVRGPQARPEAHELIGHRPQADACCRSSAARGRHRRRRSRTTSSSSCKLKPPSKWPQETPTLGDVMVAIVPAPIDEIPGVEVNFSQPIRDNVNENISGQFGRSR